MQLVLGNWANFQLHVSHATENQLHKTVAKCQISSSGVQNTSLVDLLLNKGVVDSHSLHKISLISEGGA
jgi:hypothetical protein